MLKIRLQRVGRKNEPHFRVVVTEGTRGPKSNDFVEIVGSYNPKAGSVNLQKERIAYWIGQGAQSSGTVHNFLVDAGVIQGKKINVLPKKTRPVQEQAPAPEPVSETPAVETSVEAIPESDSAPSVEETPSAE